MTYAIPPPAPRALLGAGHGRDEDDRGVGGGVGAQAFADGKPVDIS